PSTKLSKDSYAGRRRRTDAKTMVIADDSSIAPKQNKNSSRRVPRVVWALGLVSLLMDLSSEMILALLPVFLVSVLGAGTVALGLIEGIAESTASITKVFAGVISDRLRRRKTLAVLGYGLAAISKPLFPLASSVGWVLTARFVDRIGKGMRGAPRDALVADFTPLEVRGAAYGLRQALDTAGALLGPLAAIALMMLLADQVRKVFWIAVLPAFAAVAVLAICVKEPPKEVPSGSSRWFPRREDLRQLSGAFWFVVVFNVIFTLARFSEAFLVLRAYDAGLDFAWAPLAFVVMNLTYFVSSYPFGRLADRMNRTALLAAGLALLIVADLILALANSLPVVMLGIALWGLHMGVTQGMLSAMVADSAPIALRGSSFGVFHFSGGLSAMASSLLAGALWAWQGPAGTFLAGATFSAVALAGLLYWRKSG
ncbi:MAG: MFS transporter, partial [Thermoguttaceae bacterium]